jgi:hypothetical protein
MRANRLLVGLYLAAAALPLIAMRLGWRDRELEGVLAPVRREHLTLDTVRSEVYQAKYTAWFEQRRGLRNWSIWIDNTLLFHGFGETKWGATVVVGRDGVLFHRDDLAYYNAQPQVLPDPRDVDHLADRIAAVQQRLRREHRALVPVFVPSKTTIFPDAVPARWTLALGDPRPSTERVYRAMKRALDARHVVYVDGIDLLLRSSEPRDRLWGPGARHFSVYAACLCTHEIVGRYAELTGTPPFDYPCQVAIEPGRPDHGDRDLYRLTNAWGVDADPIDRGVRHDPLPATPAPDAPRAMWIATSFGWFMLDDAQQSRRFRQIHLDYYHYLLYEAGTPGQRDTATHDAWWQSVFPTRDLYVLELFESYLIPGRFFGGDALDTLEAALGPESPPRPPAGEN